MADPFESLRHDAESTGSTAIDPRFRAELLAEARRRLSSEVTTDSIRPRVPADTPTHTPMEPITMLAKNPKKTRPLLLAAACIALVAAGVVAVVALRSDGDKPPATTDTTPATTRITVPTETHPTTPETVAPSTTSTSPSPATEPPTEDALAHDMLLATDEYARGWFPTTSATPGSFEPEKARGIAECQPFGSSVFDLAAVTQDMRAWEHVSPPSLFGQNVVVLPDAEVARTLFATLNGAEFAPCAVAYNDSPGVWLPIFFDRPAVEAPGGAVGDEMVYRRYPGSWTDSDGLVHYETVIEASIRVGRSLIFIGTLNAASGEQVVSEAEFGDILTRVVERATSALGVPVPTPASTSPVAVSSAADIAASLLLTADEYAPDWEVTPDAIGYGASIDSDLATSIPECTAFLDTVFAHVEPGAGVYRRFDHSDPGALFTQYVAVFADDSTARSVYEIVNSPEFAPCALAYGTAIAPGAAGLARSFPSPVDQPIVDPPFTPVGDAMTYRTFEEGGIQTDIDAVLLVGRTITFMGTVTDGEGGATLNTVDQFEASLQRVVERANAALKGNPIT